jgi:hypothetical protein
VARTLAWKTLATTTPKFFCEFDYLNHSPHVPQNENTQSKNLPIWKMTRVNSSTCASPQELYLQPKQIRLTLSQLRPPQVQRNKPHHQGQGSCICPDLRRKGWRERSIHRREPSLRTMRFRTSDGREWWFPKQIGATGWSAEERMEWKHPKINA